MQPKDLENIATQWLDAFNARNLDALLSLYADDAQHFSPKLQVHKPETNGLVKGKDALRDWWEGAYLRLPTLYYKVTNLTANESRVFMEYIRTVDGEPDMAVAELLEVEDGRIVFSRVYHG